MNSSDSDLSEGEKHGKGLLAMKELLKGNI